MTSWGEDWSDEGTPLIPKTVFHLHTFSFINDFKGSASSKQCAGAVCFRFVSCSLSFYTFLWLCLYPLWRISHNLSRWHVNPFVEFYVSVVLAIRLYGCLWNRGTLLAWCMPVRLWCEGQAPVCVISHLQLHHNTDFQDVKPYVQFCCRLVRVSLQFLDSIWRQCSITNLIFIGWQGLELWLEVESVFFFLVLS